jgi:hypothetical protein
MIAMSIHYPTPSILSSGKMTAARLYVELEEAG